MTFKNPFQDILKHYAAALHALCVCAAAVWQEEEGGRRVGVEGSSWVQVAEFALVLPV